MQSHGVSETFRMRGCQTLEEPLAGIEDILVRNWFGCLFDSPFRAVKCKIQLMEETLSGEIALRHIHHLISHRSDQSAVCEFGGDMQSAKARASGKTSLEY